jgi:hypothetical protein
MPTGFLDPAYTTLTLVLVLACRPLRAQQVDLGSTPPHTPTLTSGVERRTGTEPSSKIQYARLILKGTLHAAAKGAADPPPPDTPPMLIAQCSLSPNGKYLFEMFASFGGTADLAFYPPWKPAGSQDLFPPRTDKVNITMDFLGYTHVKPFRRQWEIPTEAPSLYHYNPPGFGSPNLEPISYFLRYLLSLPTLRLTLNDRSSEFLTGPFLVDIRQEPLCQAASL